MKKSAALGLVFILCSAQALAYENPSAGYYVKDKDPAYRLESNKVYAFSNLAAKDWNKKNFEQRTQESAHIISYYTTDDMNQILGESFSTQYFDDVFYKLSVLKKSELNLLTIPLPLLDLQRYADFKKAPYTSLTNDVLKEEFAKVAPTVRIDKFNDYKAITISYLYQRNNNLININSTLVSKNDRLYMLTTMTADAEALVLKNATPKKDIIDNKDVDLTKNEKGLKGLGIEPVDQTTIDVQVLKNLWNKHLELVKNVKLTTPISNVQNLMFKDSITNKTILLPEDWFYGQVQFKEKEGDGNLTFAAPLQSIKKMSQDLDYVGLLKVIDDKSSDVLKTRAKSKEESFKALRNFDALLITSSLKIKDQELNSYFDNYSLSDKAECEQLINSTLNRLQKYNDDIFTLNDYTYDFLIADDKINVKIAANTKLLNTFAIKNTLDLYLLRNKNKNIASLLFYAQKNDFDNKKIADSIESWQF